MNGRIGPSLDRLAAGSRLSDDLDSGLARKKLDESRAHEIVVVGDQHPRHVLGPP